MKNAIYHIWLQTAIGPYSRLAREILPRFESIEALFSCDDFSFLGKTREKYIKRLENKDTSNAFEIAKRCQAVGARVTGYYDVLYPESLRRIEIPPVALYSIGEFRNLNDIPCIAIVGTRKMSDYGKEIAERFAYTFAKSGAYVISGLAKGVDTAAHRGAIMADGYTVAVLGNPIGDVYPKENLKAFETLYKRGLVMSELYPGCPRTKADFPNRNRIISGISDTVVIGEAGENSGALITARHAINQGRHIYAVPGAIGAENAGTNMLIKTGVPVATEPYDVLSELALEYPESMHPYEPSVTEGLRSYGNVINNDKKAEPLVKCIPLASEDALDENKNIESNGEDSLSTRIISCLKGKTLTADEIANAVGGNISEVLSELTIMEISDLIVSSAGGRYSAK